MSAGGVMADFLRVDMSFWAAVLKFNTVSQPGRYGDQPIRHGTRQGGFDDLVEAG